MTEKSFIRVDEVAEELDVSKSYAYKVIKQLNDELSAKGYLLASTTIYDPNSKSNTLNNKQTRELVSRACSFFIEVLC